MTKENKERKPVNYDLVARSVRVRHSFYANGKFGVVCAYKILSITSMGAFLPRLDFGGVNEEVTVFNCALFLSDVNNSGESLSSAFQYLVSLIAGDGTQFLT